jgi:hypothetical protein
MNSVLPCRKQTNCTLFVKRVGCSSPPDPAKRFAPRAMTQTERAFTGQAAIFYVTPP